LYNLFGNLDLKFRRNLEVSEEARRVFQISGMKIKRVKEINGSNRGLEIIVIYAKI
jgi:hypothetical protein